MSIKSGILLAGSRWTLLAALGVGVLSGCKVTNPGRGETCGTQIGDPDELLVGCVYGKSGEPAFGATVELYPSQSRASAKAAASTVGGQAAEDILPISTLSTDGSGRYAFSGVAEGNYDVLIQAKDNEGAVFHSQIRISKQVTSRYTDRLKARGIFSGSLKNALTGLPVSGAFCSVPDKPFNGANSSEGGYFAMALPEGTYSITCSKSSYQILRLDSMNIVSDSDTHIDTVMSEGDLDDYRLTPGSVRATYDSATGSVQISWNHVSFPGFAGYVLRRTDRAAPSDIRITYSIMDTTYRDQVFMARSDTARKTLYYSVACAVQGSSRNTTWSRYIRLDTLQAPAVVGANIDLSGASGDTVFAVGAEAKWVAHYDNPLRINTKLTWVTKRWGTDPDADVITDSLVREIRSLAGTDTLVYPCAAEGRVEVGLTVEDERGVTNMSSRRFTIKNP